MLTWGYATAADIDAYYGDRPRETMRAVVIRMDGVAVGVIGLAKEVDRDRAFSECKPVLCAHLRSIVVLRAIKAFMKLVEASRIPVYAISEGTGVLDRLGFRHVDGDVYEWPN
jgi:hypothetical protein